MRRIGAQLLVVFAVCLSASQAAASILGSQVPNDAHTHHTLLDVVIVLLLVALCAAVALLLRSRRLRTQVEEQAQALRQELEQRKEAERRLREREASLGAVLGNTESIVFILAPDGTILLSEGRGLKSLGLSEGAHKGRRFQDLGLGQADWLGYYERCLRGEQVQDVVRLAAGAFQLHAEPLLAPDGTVESIVGILIDVSEAESVRASLAESEARFRSIFENAPYAIVINRMSDGFYVDVNAAFVRSIGLSKEEIRRLDPQTLTRMSAEESLAYRRRIQEEGGITDQTETIVRSDGSVAHVLFSSAPVTVGGEPCIISITVDMTSRRQAELALAQSEEKYRAIFNNSPIGIYRTTFSGRFVEANPTLARMLGYASREELLANVVDLSRDIYPTPSERKRFLDALLATPKAVSMEIEFKRKDGSQLFAIIHASLQYDEAGNPAWLDGTVEDISERKRAEDALRKSESLLRALKACIPDLVWLKDFNGVYLSCNPAFERLFGAKEANILGRRDHDFVDAELAEFFLTNDRKAMEAGRPTRNEEWLTFPDTGYRGLFETIKTPMRDDSGALVGVLGIARDISERKEQELELRRWKQRFEIVNAAAQHVFYDHDMLSGDIQWTGATQAMVGLSPEEMSGSNQKWADLLHPEDAPEVLRRAEEARERCGHFVSEYRLRHADGHNVHVYESGVYLPDETGRAGQMLGILQDITERKERELELQRWMQRFDIVNTAAQHVFYDYDMASDSVLWTGASQAVMGLSPEELHGPLHKWADMLHPDDAPDVLRQLAEAHFACGKFQADYRLRHHDGHYIYVHESGVFLPGESGRPVQMLGILQDISARKNAELALSASEKMYRTLFESAEDTILVLDGQRIVDCNRSAITLFGCGKSLLMGKTPASLSPPRQPDGTDSVDAMEHVLEQAASGQRLRFDWVSRRADGASIDVEVSLTPMDVGDTRYLLALLRDVTARRQAEDMLRQSEEKFSKVFSLAPYCISIVSLPDSIFMDANEAFEPLTGYSVEEALGRGTQTLGLWVDPAQRLLFLSQLESLGKVVDFEFLLRRKDGVVRNALNSAQLIDIAGETCLISLIRDITEMKLVQQSMVQAEKMTSLGGLAAGMAHEINNPLGIIFQSVLGVQRRLDPSIPANRKEAALLGVELEAVHEYMERRNILRYLEGIREAGQRAAEIVRHMLNFSRRSDSGIVDQDAEALVRQAVSLAEKDYDLKKKYDFRQIDVRLEFSEALPSIPCIPSEIEQVLLNLLRNAAQAMAEAKTVGPAIVVRVNKVGEHAVIEVEDNGPGIPPDQLGRVFEPFYTTKKVGEGTGLGLSVSYFIITATHRGEMRVVSELGHGTRFTIKLPLSRRHVQAAVAADVAPPPTAAS